MIKRTNKDISGSNFQGGMRCNDIRYHSISIAHSVTLGGMEGKGPSDQADNLIVKHFFKDVSSAQNHGSWKVCGIRSGHGASGASGACAWATSSSCKHIRWLGQQNEPKCQVSIAYIALQRYLFKDRSWTALSATPPIFKKTAAGIYPRWTPLSISHYLVKNWANSCQRQHHCLHQ